MYCKAAAFNQSHHGNHNSLALSRTALLIDKIPVDRLLRCGSVFLRVHIAFILSE